MSTRGVDIFCVGDPSMKHDAVVVGDTVAVFDLFVDVVVARIYIFLLEKIWLAP